MNDASAIHYRIVPSHPQAHLYTVTMTVPDPDPAGQRLALPAWIPGSYMIREFARNVVRIQARSGRKAVALEKLDKHTWRAAACSGPLTIECEVYAWDLSVRGAHLDTTHGFFNGTSVFLRALGREHAPCSVEILPPAGARYRGWRVATSLPRDGARLHGFGRYRAADYDELIDHPVEMGELTLATFTARGVPHDVAISGRHGADMPRLVRDLTRVCEHHIDFFGGRAPMERYVFLVTVVGEGYGGLEHRASTALLCSRDDLPRAGDAAGSEAYRGFLGLASHEYFHTWNVKRIRPSAFTPYDLDRENYTRLLWAFEGITSYYDDLALVRSGLMTVEQYLAAIARTTTSVLRGSGRLRQTLEDSSFDAWIKYYRQDENAPNAIVSYYAKGALAALALDLTLRARTRGRRSLDDVMRALWQEHGLTGIGVDERGIERLAERVCGVRLGRFFETALRSTHDLPLAALLRQVGVELDMRRAASPSDRGGHGAGSEDAALAKKASLGARTESAGGEVRLVQVFDDGAAQAAGLSAGDVLVALDTLRVGPSNLERVLGRYRAGDRARVHAFRRDELFETTVHFQAPPQDTCWLRPLPRPTSRQRALREGWLGTRRARR